MLEYFPLIYQNGNVLTKTKSPKLIRKKNPRIILRISFSDKNNHLRVADKVNKAVINSLWVKTLLLHK